MENGGNVAWGLATLATLREARCSKIILS